MPHTPRPADAATPTAYNGWSNWETWVTYTWLTSDERTQEDVRHLLADPLAPDRAGALQAYVDTLCQEEAGEAVGLVADLYGSALERVNWAELLGHFT